VPDYPAFRTGMAMGPDWDAGGEGRETSFATAIPAVLRWTAHDPSGICGYKVEDVNHEDHATVLQRGKATSYAGTLSLYAGEFGSGGTTRDYWQVTARDCAGNATVGRAHLRPNVIQEDGFSPTEQPFAEFKVGYTGKWKTVKCTCWASGAVRMTTAKGAAVTFTTYVQRDGHIAVVMPKGPNRGKALIKVDGAPVAVIDTYSPKPKHRIVMWEAGFEEGSHTVSVINLATPGRPRIDVDAFLTLGQWTTPPL